MLRQLSVWAKNYFILKMAEKMFWPLTIAFPHWNMPCLQMSSQTVLMILYWPRDILATGYFSVLLQGCTRFDRFCFKIGQIRDRIHVFFKWCVCKVFQTTLSCFCLSGQCLLVSWVQTWSMYQDYIPSSDERYHTCISGSLKNREHIHWRWLRSINNYQGSVLI